MQIFKYAFTLVELLITIAILGVMIAISFPSLNVSQESNRVIKCKYHLKILGNASWTHNSEQRILPSGGWGRQFAGDSTRGFRELQPGGWLYNILPYLDNRALHDMPGPDRMKTPVPEFHCPSKRKPVRYPFDQKGNVMCYKPSGSSTLKSFSSEKEVARNDYAANGGTYADPCVSGISFNHFDSLEPLFNQSQQPVMQLREYARSVDNNCSNSTGSYCLFSGVSIDTISYHDGASNTIMFGERHINPEHYSTGIASDDSLGWDQGYDRDTVRWGGADKSLFGMTNGLDYNPETIAKIKDYYSSQNLSKNFWIPIQDKAGYTSPSRWGSPHAESINFCMVDSSVLSVSYKIDPFVFYCLCSYRDGQIIPEPVLE